MSSLRSGTSTFGADESASLARQIQLRSIAAVFLVALILGVAGMAWLQGQIAGKYLPIGVDVYHIWLGSSAFWQGSSPYDDSIRAHAQQLIYGTAGTSDPDIFKIYYPAYIALVIGPLLLLPLNIAAVVWSGAMWAVFATFVLLWSWWLRPPLAPWTWGIVLFSGLLFRPALLAALNGQYALFTLACGALFWWLAARGRNGLAGAVLALATIKPSIALFLPAILLLWAFRWKRWNCILGFVLSLALLMALSVAKIGWWVPDFLRQALTYTQDNPDAAWLPAQVFTVPGLVWLGLALVILGVGLRCLWSQQTLPWLALIGALNLNLILTPHVVEYDLTMLLMPLFWLGSQWRRFPLGLALWVALIWLPWLSWMGVMAWIGIIDVWWRGIWLFYPVLVAAGVSAWLAREWQQWRRLWRPARA